MKKLIIIACILRLITNVSKYVIIDDLVFSYVFLFGCLVFELVALIYFEKKETSGKDLSSMFLNFCIGLNIYSIYKLVWADANEYTTAEYWGVIIGAFIMIGKYVYARFYKRVL